MQDMFRPHTEPARRFYDAFQHEATMRRGRKVEDWISAELRRMWHEARDYAEQQGLEVLTMDTIVEAEECARGHVDYASKWAYGIASHFPSRPC